MDGLRDDGLVVGDGVMIKEAVGGGVIELAPGLGDVEVSVPYHNCASLIRGFYSEIGVGAEGAEGCTFCGGEVGVSGRGGEVEVIDVVTAVRDEEVEGGWPFSLMVILSLVQYLNLVSIAVNDLFSVASTDTISQVILFDGLEFPCDVEARHGEDPRL
eukprot:g25506.t1